LVEPNWKAKENDLSLATLASVFNRSPAYEATVGSVEPDKVV
jgi:hypothetical protein